MKKIITIGIALTLLALACGEEPVDTPNEIHRLLPTSPRAVLINVETAFNRCDINLLKAMLSKDFVFYFDPRDVGQNPPGGSPYVIPESWTYTEFWQAVQRMFTGAYSISLTIPAADAGKPGPEESTYLAENIQIKILVMIDEVNGYLVDDGYCNFEFERYDGSEGRRFWRLTKWWDRTGHGYDSYPGVSPSTLGKILSLYRLPRRQL